MFTELQEVRLLLSEKRFVAIESIIIILFYFF